MLVKSNVHQRKYPVAEDRVGALLDRLSGADDQIWPAAWPPIHFDRPLAVGAEGGHGPIRYSVIGYEPGRRVEFRFDPRIGLVGTHALEVHRAAVPV